MSYATQTDLERLVSPAVLVQLADDDADGTADAAIVADALARAAAEIDARCALRYQVPFSPVPALVTGLAVDLALYHLYTRRSNADVPQIRKDRYDAAIRLLTDVAAGRATLGVQPPPAADTTSQDDVAATRTASDRIFTIGKPSDGVSGSLDTF